MLQQLSDMDVDVVQAGLVDLDGSYVFLLGLFLLFFAVLHALVIKPMMKTHQRRYDSMEGARQEAEAMDLKAVGAAANYDAKLDAARQEAVKLRDALREEGEGEARTHLAGAREEVAHKMAKAQARNDSELKKAESELELGASALADDIVKRLIGKAGG